MGERVTLEGATNFRDLGGYRAEDGRTVRRGRVFRSDALHRLTDRDHRVLAGLGIETVCDLRYREECEREPSRLPAELDIEVLHVGLPRRPAASFVDSLDLERGTVEVALAYLSGNYRQYPELYAPAYRIVLERLLVAREGALVFHCTAGKDRAGFAAAVVLRTLGIPDETVLEDYLMTNRRWDRGGRVPDGWPRDVVEAMFTAREEYLRAGFAAIDDAFGSFDRYLEERVGFTEAKRAALRERLLE